MWEISRFKLFSHRINNVYKFLCMCNIICMHVTCTVITVHTICEGLLQHVSINGFNSNLEHIHCGVTQGSILGPLLFLIYINDLNCAIRYCSVYHLPDDTDLLNYNNSVKRMNKYFNQDLKKLKNWLNANKICLNISKTEVVSFKSSKKLIDISLKLKHNGKRLYPTNS